MEEVTGQNSKNEHTKNPRRTRRRRVIKQNREEQEKSEKEPRKRRKTNGTHKKKKLKGLSKKDKEETQKTIASCERQKSSRLTAACQAPLAQLEDIVKKALSTAEQPSCNPSTHTFNPSTTELTEKNGKKREQISQPPTSPIKDFSSDDEHNDQLPSLDQINALQPSNNEKQRKEGMAG
ncbi:hypothetical protein H4Q26_010830 [Puccinia striiformis f. sp. tritici PST-130]|nr:hypothetical protein Pst134EB_027260 [Puccinia striiformis f. sp. tritici]KAI9616438.1 hypothetical protein H4Q26_010830 [Puccinia striiformis f. sp. tritici PST-130]